MFPAEGMFVDSQEICVYFYESLTTLVISNLTEEVVPLS